MERDIMMIDEQSLPECEIYFWAAFFDQEQMLENMPDIDAANAQGETALHFAAWSDAEKAASCLLKRGAKCTPNKLRHTPLHYCAAYNSAKVAKLLASVGHSNGVDCCAMGHSNGVDCCAMGHSNSTPFHIAARCKSYDVFRELASCTAIPMSKDDTGMTVAQYCAKDNTLFEIVIASTHRAQNVLAMSWPEAGGSALACALQDRRNVPVIMEHGRWGIENIARQVPYLCPTCALPPVVPINLTCGHIYCQKCYFGAYVKTQKLECQHCGTASPMCEERGNRNIQSTLASIHGQRYVAKCNITLANSLHHLLCASKAAYKSFDSTLDWTKRVSRQTPYGLMAMGCDGRGIGFTLRLDANDVYHAMMFAMQLQYALHMTVFVQTGEKPTIMLGDYYIPPAHWSEDRVTGSSLVRAAGHVMTASEVKYINLEACENASNVFYVKVNEMLVALVPFWNIGAFDYDFICHNFQRLCKILMLVSRMRPNVDNVYGMGVVAAKLESTCVMCCMVKAKNRTVSSTVCREAAKRIVKLCTE